MRKNDRSGPGIATRSVSGIAAIPTPATPAPGTSGIRAAYTPPPQQKQAQIDKTTTAPTTEINRRREDIIAEHLFRALCNRSNQTSFGEEAAATARGGGREAWERNPRSILFWSSLLPLLCRSYRAGLGRR